MPNIEELRAKAPKFHRKIKRRNMAEYIAGIFVIIGFGWMMVFGPLPWTPTVIPPTIIRLGAALVLAGTAIVLWQLHKRTHPLSPPKDGGLHSILDFQRRELERQRDAVDDVFFWYILPFVPGLVVMNAVPMVLAPVIGDASWLQVLAKISIIPIALIAVWWVNKRAARKLQAEIDQIDALRAE